MFLLCLVVCVQVGFATFRFEEAKANQTVNEYVGTGVNAVLGGKGGGRQCA